MSARNVLNRTPKKKVPSMTTEKQIASANLDWLHSNPYPGHGLILGLDESGKNLVQIYWIMGRSPNSRNRVFVSETWGRLFTQAADPSKVKDPSLIIYDAMLEKDGYYVVSNGNQTTAVLDGHHRFGYGMEKSLRDFNFQYEPDSPNFTPRITGVCLTGYDSLIAEIAVLRKSPWGKSCERSFHKYVELGQGFGHCVTTYSGDGNPLPAFTGAPMLMPLLGDIVQICDTFWNALNPDNRVSLAVKFISKQTGISVFEIRNKYAPV